MSLSSQRLCAAPAAGKAVVARVVPLTAEAPPPTTLAEGRSGGTLPAVGFVSSSLLLRSSPAPPLFLNFLVPRLSCASFLCSGLPFFFLPHPFCVLLFLFLHLLSFFLSSFSLSLYVASSTVAVLSLSGACAPLLSSEQHASRSPSLSEQGSQRPAVVCSTTRFRVQRRLAVRLHRRCGERRVDAAAHPREHRGGRAGACDRHAPCSSP